MQLQETELANLKAFLSEKLQSISDADPDVLSDYIVVLLEHSQPTPELKDNCKSQLEEFLTTNTSSFVDELFDYLEQKRHLVISSTLPAESSDAQAYRATHSSHSERSRRRSRSRSPARFNENDGRGSRDDRYDDRRHLDSDMGIDMDMQSERPHEYNSRNNGAMGELNETGSFQMGGNQSMLDQPGLTGTVEKSHKPCFAFQRTGRCTKGDRCRYQHVRQPPFHAGPMGFPGAMGPGRPFPGGPFPGHNGSHFAPGPMMMQQGPPGEGIRPAPGAGPGSQWGRRPHSHRSDSAAPLSDTILIVNKVPMECMATEAIISFFSQFGEIKNVQLEPERHRAEVEFADPAAARAAFDSPMPIFGNRFVTVFWKKLGGGAEGSTFNASGPYRPTWRPPVRPLPFTPDGTSFQSRTYVREGVQPHGEGYDPKLLDADRKLKLLEIQKLKQGLITSQLEQQKKLLGMLGELPAGSAEKETILVSLRKVKASLEKLLASATDGTKTTVEALHTTDGDTDEKQKLQSQLDTLRAQAKALGINPHQPGSGTGRGMPASAPRSFKLDNRPRNIRVANVPDEMREDVKVKFTTFGHSHNIIEPENTSDMIFQYEARWQAEQAMTKAASVPELAPFSITWLANQEVPSGESTATQTPTQSSSMAMDT
ncbi:hypothetical protein IWQ62_002761 [Dispira parvispora]|uniref:Uncharacterized protein n=1 Tax=Dispira parvispora TaxID=1520584 RepID=A0A9W8E3I9_9FUNG|nr:hypothetical protein IWQ62_002761 [Dispira parvispora]